MGIRTSGRAVAFVCILTLSLAALICSGAPAMELMDQPETKQRPLQDDVEEFYKDQEHLVPYRQNDTSTNPTAGGIWTSMSQFWNIHELLAILAQFGLPISSVRCEQGVCYPLEFPARLQKD